MEQRDIIEQVRDMFEQLEHSCYTNETLALGPCPHKVSLITRDPVPVLFVEMERTQVHPSQVDVFRLARDADQLLPGMRFIECVSAAGSHSADSPSYSGPASTSSHPMPPSSPSPSSRPSNMEGGPRC